LYGKGRSCPLLQSSTKEVHIPENLKQSLAYRTLHQPAPGPSSLSTRVSTPAPYFKDRTPLPSVQRPHVLARDRLRLWLPLSPRNALDQECHPTNLTLTDIERVREVMIGAWADSTRETYGSGLLIFHVFCDKKNISEAQRAPASPILIASFIATLCGTYSGTAITNYVCGIQAWHVLHGLSWHMNTAEVDALLKAAKKSTPPTSKRKKRQPYTISFMISIRDNLDLTDPLHAAVFACLTTTFYAAARLGEFTTKTLKDFHPSTHVKPADVRVEVDRNGFHSTIFALPSTKSESINGEEVSWCRQNGDTDPEAALNHHLATNTPSPLRISHRNLIKTSHQIQIYQDAGHCSLSGRSRPSPRPWHKNRSHARVSTLWHSFRRHEGQGPLGQRRFSGLPQKTRSNPSPIHAGQPCSTR
jgi:hypothetical protein